MKAAKSKLNLRPEIKNKELRVVIKLGSEAVTFPGGGSDQNKINSLVQEMSELVAAGVQIIVVSSGAIHTARGHLNWAGKDISSLQALSAFGQPLLMRAYGEAMERVGLKCAQILLTHEDFKARARYFNAKNTIFKLLSSGIIPILNENDTVSFNEITVGDNDQLAAMTAEMIEANLVLLLSATDGLYDKNPSQNDAVRFDTLDFKSDLEKLKSIQTKGKSSAGRGGMDSKLSAIRKICEMGIPVILSSHKIEGALQRALSQNVGTYFPAQNENHFSNRKSWLLATVRPGCKIKIDEGAMLALQRGSSLLPSGIIEVEGQFKRGDSITIVHKRKMLAVGLTEYDAKEIRKIKGHKAKEIEAILGHCPSEEVIHRDHLLLKIEESIK